MKKILKSRIFFFILGALIFGCIGAVFAYSLIASDVSFTPKDSSWEVDNVKKALDELHDVRMAPLSKLKQENVKGTYKQAHSSSNNSLSVTLQKGTYLVLLIYSYAGGNTSANYSYVGTSRVHVTPSTGTCTVIDTQRYQSTGNSVVYSGSYRFNSLLDFEFYTCSFSESSTLTTTTMGTNSYDPDSYVLRYIKIK